MFERMSVIGAGLLLVAVSGRAALAGPVYWTTPSGSTSQLTYSDGQSDKGLYGNPTVVGNTFQFLTPHDFDAESSNGTADTTADRLSFKITGTAGKFTQINILEYGEWSIFGDSASIKDSGALYVTNLDSGHFGVMYSLTPTVTYTNVETGTTSSSVPTSEGTGTWKASYFLTLPISVQSAQLVLNNVVQATSTPGSTAFLQKDAISITAVIPTTSTPEPASLGLLAIGGTTLLRRRRASLV